MTPLEDRYRSLLRVLPSSYRERWEEDMVDVLLARAEPHEGEPAGGHAEEDEPDPDDVTDRLDGWPPLAEVGSVLALAVRLGLGGRGAPPRSLVWGDGVRLAVLLHLLAMAVLALVDAGGRLLHARGGLPPDSAGGIGGGWWWPALGLLWAVAFVLLVARRPAAGRVPTALLTVLLAASVVQSTIAVPRGHPVSAFTVVSWLLLGLVVTAVAGAFHADAPPVSRRRWLVALGAGTALMAGWPLVRLLTHVPAEAGTAGPSVLDLLRPEVVALLGAAAVHMVLTRWRGGSRPAWSIALGSLVVLELVRYAAALPYLRPVPGADEAERLVAAMVAGQVTALAIAALALWSLAARQLARVPTAADADASRGALNG
jgi:hypothetical protein